MVEAPGNALIGEPALPVQRFHVRHCACLDNLEKLHNPSAPLPLIAQRFPKIPMITPISTQAARPGILIQRYIGAPRKPTSSAPNAPSTAMTPRCQMLSSGKLRYHASPPPRPMASSSPAVRALDAGSVTGSVVR